MKKLYFLDEDEKNRVLSLHETATKKQYLIERDAVQNDGSGLESIKSILIGLGLNPIEKKTLPKGYINIGTLNIPNLQVKTNLGWFVFFSAEPGGYWTDNNFVVQNNNNVFTIGTWDFDRLYMKKTGVVDVLDKDFNNIIQLSQLKPVVGTQTKDVKQPEVKTDVNQKAVVDPKKAYQQRAQQVAQQTQTTTKQIQQSLGQEQTGTMDPTTVERLIDLLKQ